MAMIDCKECGVGEGIKEMKKVQRETEQNENEDEERK